MNLSQAGNGLHGLGEMPPASATQHRTIPFDYAFRFDLKGQPDAVQNSTVTVSIEASFTTVSIGYGVVPKISPVRFGLLPESVTGGFGDAPNQVRPLVENLRLKLVQAVPIPDVEAPAEPIQQRNALREFSQQAFLRLTVAALAERLEEPIASDKPVIGPRTAAALRDGLRFNPEFINRLLTTLDGAAFDETTILEAFQVVAAPPDRIQFKYALFDEGSGREFQSEPTLSTAGLGSSDGRRPFRYFAQPIEFAPRTSIRMQITEVSDFQGELHVSLQGYKTLGGRGSPTATMGSSRRRTFRRMRR